MSGIKKPVWAVAVLLAGVAMFALVQRQCDRSPRDKALEQTETMETAYFEAPFGEAFSAVEDSIEYLEAHRQELLGHLKVDAMIYSAHAMAGYMLLHSNDVTRAEDEFEAAYEYYCRYRVNHNLEVMPRNKFVDLVISGRNRFNEVRGVV